MEDVFLEQGDDAGASVDLGGPASRQIAGTAGDLIAAPADRPRGKGLI